MMSLSLTRSVILHALRSSSMCQRSCCWTPFGCSGVAVNCQCHTYREDDVASLVRGAIQSGQVYL